MVYYWKEKSQTLKRVWLLVCHAAPTFRFSWQADWYIRTLYRMEVQHDDDLNSVYTLLMTYYNLLTIILL